MEFPQTEYEDSVLNCVGRQTGKDGGKKREGSVTILSNDTKKGEQSP